MKNPPPPKKISTLPNMSSITPVSIGASTIPDTAPMTSSIRGFSAAMIPSVHPSPISGGRLPYGPFCIRSASSFAASSNESFSLSNSSLHSSAERPWLERSWQRKSSISAKVSGGQSVAGTAPALSAQISSTGSSLPRAANKLSIISSEENTSAIHSLALALATSAANLSVSASAVPFSKAQT